LYPESGDKPSTLPEVSKIYPTVLYYPQGKRQETSGEDGEVSRGRGEERRETEQADDLVLLVQQIAALV
jgi:hypothetical protein